MITITFSEQEIAVLQALLDRAVRQGGLEVAQAAWAFNVRLMEALAKFQNQNATPAPALRGNGAAQEARSTT